MFDGFSHDKTDYPVRLNVNIVIAGSVSFNFNFGNGYYGYYDKTRFFLNE